MVLEVDQMTLLGLDEITEVTFHVKSFNNGTALAGN